MNNSTEYRYEYTDTYGGQANYCWVKRGTIEAKNLKSAVRKAKKEVGLNGVRCQSINFGDEVHLRPCGSCTILFVS